MAIILSIQKGPEIPMQLGVPFGERLRVLGFEELS
jgi:hypothetical protein